MKSVYVDRDTRSILDVHDVTDHLPSLCGATGVWRVSRVNVPIPHRGKGIARKLLEQVCYDADTEHFEIVLEAIPDGSQGSLDFSALVAFYERLGFINSTTLSGNMHRPPLSPF